MNLTHLPKGWKRMHLTPKGYWNCSNPTCSTNPFQVIHEFVCSMNIACSSKMSAIGVPHFGVRDCDVNCRSLWKPTKARDQQHQSLNVDLHIFFLMTRYTRIGTWNLPLAAEVEENKRDELGLTAAEKAAGRRRANMTTFDLMGGVIKFLLLLTLTVRCPKCRRVAWIWVNNKR
jgi:hypothetical protein